MYKRQPTLYGFIPRTYCGERIHRLSPKSTGGDGDPLDICVISERPINKSEIILNARVVGGIQMIDGGEADDKIIAVLYNDNFWENANDLADIPTALIDRLQHYFSTYKLVAGNEKSTYIAEIYNAERAFEVVNASLKDYEDIYGTG